jgi:hypothetical protein
MVRYADDAIIGCERREDAERIYKVLAGRFEKYGLKVLKWGSDRMGWYGLDRAG